MADLNIWFGSLEVTDSGGGGQPALSFDDDAGRCVVRTVTNCATSKQTIPAPDLGAGLTPAIAQAIGGALWLAVGDNPVAAASGDGALFLREGDAVSLAVPKGKKIAAIDA